MKVLNFRQVNNSLPPDEWIYKNYLQIRDNLDGRVLRIFSAFNSEKTPSMFLYYRAGKYRWKDHSSGKSGDALDLAKAVFSQSLGYDITFSDTIDLIKDDYRNWKDRNGGEFKKSTIKSEHYLYDLVCRYSIRQFNYADIQYWKQFGVEKQLLEIYKIRSLEYFQLGKKRNIEGVTMLPVTKWMNKINSEYSYGYFQGDNDLIQIYNPKREDLKHVTLKKELFGREQLNAYANRTVIIASSMKDLLAIKALNLKVDVVASIGEKVIIDKRDINYLKDLYTNVFTLFDNDKTGIKAMQLYKTLYDIDFIYFPYEKDIADARLQMGETFTKNHLVPAITRAIYKNTINEDDKKN